MKESHGRYTDGKLADDVHSHPPFPADVRSYVSLPQVARDFTVPSLRKAGEGDVRIFVANFDGTGNDMYGDSDHMTNVGWIHNQLLGDSVPEWIKPEYVAGPGTQKNAIVKLFDGATGFTYDARLEQMYKALLEQARHWADENPHVTIRVISVGFSRGGEEAAGFTRLLHQRGIQDERGREEATNGDGPDQITFTRPPIAAPGTVAQAVGLFDPVGTGRPHQRDRHLPPSVISGFQIVARDERRNLFPSSQIMTPGISEDGRFWSVEVPGSHSDIGGSYHLDGLSVVNGNYMADYINSLLPEPVLTLREETMDATRYAIHHSEEHSLMYRTTVYDRDGLRDVVGSQLSPPHCRFVVVCAPPDAVDPFFASMLAERHAFVAHDWRYPEILAVEHIIEPVVRPLLTAQPEPKPFDNHAFDLERHLAVGNIPLPSGYDVVQDKTPASSLQPVSRPATPDIGHDLQLARDGQTINERVRQELGPRPLAPIVRVRALEQEQTPDLEPPLDHSLNQSHEPIHAGSQVPETPAQIQPVAVEVERGPGKDVDVDLDVDVLPLQVPLAAVLEPARADAHAPSHYYPPNDPRNESHRDHRLHASIHNLLAALHEKEGIDLSPTQMERLSLATLVTVKAHGLSAVTHMQFGQDERSNTIPTIHAFEAFRDNLTDPRTGWAGLEATAALRQPEQAVIQQLQDVNMAIEQRQAVNDMDMSRQQGVGMSMNM
ncbi:DUF2235 domain-containing protein [Luteibacter pinisoli]|uniref:DUF2235 domain-containing protein n=1 Tax=Luteibacter pinisoli TaxID=2589080 RepID=A0A4Y5Z059_9GAMM|nr:DUF2235 domain-containing protein [Luteibacter pinisoli]QDE37833.1 DUF2235 domain-containing protein [Luteibacter pinisoli]